jgi:hypothetical protein
MWPLSVPWSLERPGRGPTFWAGWLLLTRIWDGCGSPAGPGTAGVPSASVRYNGTIHDFVMPNALRAKRFT